MLVICLVKGPLEGDHSLSQTGQQSKMSKSVSNCVLHTFCWAICSSVWPPSQQNNLHVLRWNFIGFKLCPFSHFLSVKSLDPSSYPPIRYLCAWISSPPRTSPSWTILVLPAFPHMKSSSQSSSWPCTALAPVIHICLVEGSLINS